ncbi:MAG TPA: hypothetical protein VGD71_24150 [Kribbella sp.]|jgi:hypothetical protein
MREDKPGAALAPVSVSAEVVEPACDGLDAVMTPGVAGRERALLLVRLRARQRDGSVVGETRRVCHLVLVPDSPTVPEFLVALCGERIGPGAGEVLASVVGMPCEACMARSSLSPFALLRERLPVADPPNNGDGWGALFGPRPSIGLAPDVSHRTGGLMRRI